MDTQSYNEFLKSRLREVQKPLENNILNLVYSENKENLYRNAGMREMLVEIVNKLDALLKDFYKSSETSPTLSEG